MKCLQLLSLTCLLMFATILEASPLTNEEIGKADAAAKTLLMGLKKKLMEEMSKGGARVALSFCSERAIPLTLELEKQIPKDWTFKRISEKNRNPQNAPDTLDQQAIDQFRASGSAKQVVVLDESHQDGVVLASRYYKPIRVEGTCLVCHGSESSISPDVKKVLREKYPADKATGYKAGDFRGVVRVRIPRVQG